MTTVDCYTFTLPSPKHKHQCLKCGCVWEHGAEAANSDEEHTCPRCGYVNFWKYTGSEPVTSLVGDEYTFYLRD